MRRAGYWRQEGRRYLIISEVSNTILRIVKKRVALSDQIRLAVDASGMSRYRICQTLGLAEATMSRFMNGHGGLSMARLDALAELLELNITLGRRPRKKGK